MIKRWIIYFFVSFYYRLKEWKGKTYILYLSVCYNYDSVVLHYLFNKYNIMNIICGCGAVFVSGIRLHPCSVSVWVSERGKISSLSDSRVMCGCLEPVSSGYVTGLEELSPVNLSWILEFALIDLWFSNGVVVSWWCVVSRWRSGPWDEDCFRLPLYLPVSKRSLFRSLNKCSSWYAFSLWFSSMDSSSEAI